MKKIGFANTFYTLWEVTEENMFVTVNGQYRQSGVKVNYFYYQNLSKDLDRAKKRFTELTGEVAPEPDSELKGKNSNFHLFRECEVYNDNEFPKGEYAGMLISECKNIPYLKWCYENILYDKRAEIAKSILLNNGFVENLCKDGVCTPQELTEAIEHSRQMDYENSLVHGFNFEDKEKVELNVKVHSVGGFSGYYGFTNIYVFVTNELKVVKYVGSKEYDIKEGENITIKGTIKHNKYYSCNLDGDVIETKILRMKVVNL